MAMRRSTRVRLRDGSCAALRPLQAHDADLVAAVFAGLGPQSRRLRFLTGKKRLSSSELHYLTAVDHHDHEALAAVSDGRGVGIARFVRSRTDPRSADLAVEVVDAWHRRGLATELLARLAQRAREEGISCFEADVDDANVAVHRLMRTAAVSVRLVDHDHAVSHYQLVLG